MTTQTAATTKDQVTIPMTLLNDMSDELSKIKDIYEQVSLLVAANQEKNWEMKSFTNVKDFFDDLDN